MSLLTRTDVTSLHIYGKFILAGIGSFVHIFDKTSKKLLERIHTLEGQKIYGFVPSQDSIEILVFGGKQFSILLCDDDNCDFVKAFEVIVCDDWLHSATWVEKDVVALLTAHNVVQKWNIRTKTLISQNTSTENSILYSGLLINLEDDVLAFAGTVFSEVIICCMSLDQPLQQLRGHRGVIFSISCNLDKGIIVTTSDDRSVRVWAIENSFSLPINTIGYWMNAHISCRHELYGHQARVMRSCITEEFIVSVGEDAAICFWDCNGKLARKVTAHGNGPIWSVHHDKEHLVTGGGDSGITLHPLTVAKQYGEVRTIQHDITEPKRVMFTARRNIIFLNDENLFYYDAIADTKEVFKLNHDSTFKLLSMSSCKQIIAIADMKGKLDVFVENCKESAHLLKVIDTKLNIGKILSMHWAGNRHLVVCSNLGIITVLTSKGDTTEEYAKFVLPICKERWLTACAIDTVKRIVIVGDRCGNIHFYENDGLNPIKSLSKVHGRYGPTSITIKNDEVITTGRDGTIKYFSFYKDIKDIRCMYSKVMEFQWVEKFIDKNENIISGFRERVLVVYDIKESLKLLEVQYGGGHRSWDALRYIEKQNEGFETFIKLVFIKNSEIILTNFELSKIMSRNVVNGSHSKEINCLKTIRPYSDINRTFFISGGEDTTLRVSSIDVNYQFQDEVIFKQLSSVKTLKLCSLGKNRVILISAGGRAQICIRSIWFDRVNDKINVRPQELVDYLIKGTDKERKGNQTWRNVSLDFDPETRIMDLDILNVDDKNFIIFTGCSDAYLRIFKLNYNDETIVFKLIREVKHHQTCILKTKCIKISNKNLLLTCTTRGQVTLWEVTDIHQDILHITSVFETITNKSGINGFDTRIMSDTELLIATGGDDNCVSLTLIEINENNSDRVIKVVDGWWSDKLHCSQVTGVSLVGDYLVTSSVDQRVSVCRVVRDAPPSRRLSAEFVQQLYTDVADVQGMDVLHFDQECVRVCVFGAGLEVCEGPRAAPPSAPPAAPPAAPAAAPPAAPPAAPAPAAPRPRHAAA